MNSLPLEVEDPPTSPDAPQPLEGLVERATELEKSARHFIQANPTVALVGALTLGFLVGRLVMR